MFLAQCQAIVGFNGIVKILLSVDDADPRKLNEHILLNIMRDKIDFEEGNTVEVIIRKAKKS